MGQRESHELEFFLGSVRFIWGGGGGQGSDSCVVLPLHELHELLYFENAREKLITKPTCTYAMMQQLPFWTRGEE